MNVFLAIIPLLKIAADITLLSIKNTDPRTRDVRYARKVAHAKRRYVVASARRPRATSRKRRRRTEAAKVYWASVLEELNETLPPI